MQGEERPGKAFEREVADAYRALGYQVTHDVQLPGQQTDLVARLDPRGSPPIVLAIECKDHSDTVGKGPVQAFVNTIAALRDSRSANAGAMVSRRGFTPDARAVVEGNPHVTLLSWDDLASEVLDVRHAMREMVEGYELSAIYQDYLPLAVERLTWETLTPNGNERPEVSTVIANWIGNEGDDADLSSLFVLADFGAGKTTLLRYIEYERAKAYLAGEEHRVPLFVSLREYRDTKDLTALLRNSFRDSYYRDMPADLLWQKINTGKVLVLLDGFDEMVERSDGEKRLDLFYVLLPVIRSPSPTIITSRPSYFVEGGELNKLLSLLRELEGTINASAWPSPGDAFLAADRLRRALISRNREARPGPHEHANLDGRTIQVIGLLPLDRPRIEWLVERKAPELATVDISPREVVEFIDRTYDLADLASRPLLLKLIVESIVLGRLDLDSNTQFGASGLYEIYTDSKLNLDFSKGKTRQEGLSTWLRRFLAEALAIKMYEGNQLEVDFNELIDELKRDDPNVRHALEGSDLTKDEIATDFATCSFVTIGPDGKCRFIHKSFRGFFVARVLKDRIAKGHSLFEAWLEREVLYFLGGFAPTQANVADNLWTRFVHADPASLSLRRNMLVAYLYTRPDHDSRRIVDAEISDADFTRLSFDRGRAKNLAWHRCSVGRLTLNDINWREVQLFDSHLEHLEAERGSLDVAMKDTTVEVLDLKDLRSAISMADSTVDSILHAGGHLNLDLDGAFAEKFEARDTTLRIEVGDNESRFASLGLSNCHAEISDDFMGAAHWEDSVVRYEGPQTSIANWQVENCAIALIAPDSLPARQRRTSAAETNGPSRDSVLIADYGIDHSLLASVPCGVFGVIESFPGGLRAVPNPTAWGILKASSILEQVALPAGTNGCRMGNVLLVSAKWYARQTAPKGELSALSALRAIAEPAPLDERVEVRMVTGLLAELAAQFKQVFAAEWPSLHESRIEASFSTELGT